MTPQPKPGSRLLAKARASRRALSLSKAVKRAVMERDQRRCRVCGRRATSVHELRFRSLGGRVSLDNSIAVCGTGTTKCHGKLQRNQLIPIGNASGRLRFVEHS
jgi:5-methylcytosine-specific restriction endonuclease McrA